MAVQPDLINYAKVAYGSPLRIVPLEQSVFSCMTCSIPGTAIWIELVHQLAVKGLFCKLTERIPK